MKILSDDISTNVYLLQYIFAKAYNILKNKTISYLKDLLQRK